MMHCDLCPATFVVAAPDDAPIQERLAGLSGEITLHFVMEHPGEGVQLSVVLEP